jgi:F0F1-type ATP synthase assembly protein I
VAIPGDPTWFIAGVIVGAGLGFLAAKVLGNKKQQ